MRYRSTRVAVVASLGFLVLWIATSLIRFAAWATLNLSWFYGLENVPWTLDLPLLGFLGLMIMGMAQHFVPLFAARDLRSERAGLIQVVLAVAGVLLDLASPVAPVLEAFGKGLWLLSSAAFVALILLTLRQPARFAHPQERHPEFRAVDRWAIPMTVTAVVYLLVGSAGFFLASPASSPILPWAAANWFAFLHLYTLGFVTLMVFGVGFHLFPRFLDAVPRLAGVRAVTVLAVPGPLGVALTMPFLGDGQATQAAFVLFAALEAAGAVVYTAVVVEMWHRSSKRRMAARFTVAGALWLTLGVSLGTLFGLDPGVFLRFVEAHGWINLLGFAGFEILGVTHEILPPFTPKGLKAVRRAALADFALATAGLGLVELGYLVLGTFADVAVAGALFVAGFVLLLTMTLIVAAGTLVTLRAIVPPRPRK